MQPLNYSDYAQWEAANVSAVFADYKDWPESPPPQGIIPDFAHPPSKQPYNILCQTIGFTITTALLLIRRYTKVRILRSAGWEDYTSILAWLGLITFGILLAINSKDGDGKQEWYVTLKDYLQNSKIHNAEEINYCAVVLVTKISILLLYLRVFAPSRPIRIITVFLLVTTSLFYTAVFFVEIFQCSPRDSIWKWWIEGKCINDQIVELTSAIFNLVSDIAILLLPIFAVKGLNVPKAKKLGIMAIFATGLFACFCSLVRIVILVRLANGASDQTWTWFPLEMWSYAEIACGISCGCMPAVPAFIRYIRSLRNESAEQGKIHKVSLIRRPRRDRCHVDLESVGTTKEDEQLWVDENGGQSEISGHIEGTCASGRHLIVLPKAIINKD